MTRRSAVAGSAALQRTPSASSTAFPEPGQLEPA